MCARWVLSLTLSSISSPKTLGLGFRALFTFCFHIAMVCCGLLLSYLSAVYPAYFPPPRVFVPVLPDAISSVMALCVTRTQGILLRYRHSSYQLTLSMSSCYVYAYSHVNSQVCLKPGIFEVLLPFSALFRFVIIVAFTCLRLCHVAVDEVSYATMEFFRYTADIRRSP